MSITLSALRPVSPPAPAPAAHREGEARPETDLPPRSEAVHAATAESALKEAGRRADEELARRDLEVRVRAAEGRPGFFVIEVRDPEGGEIVRQIPSEEAMEAAEALRELRGVLLKQEG